jgi:6-pyruvoyltetrahydropterin/6-carboxytetrahydropterin synthase
MHAEIDMLTLTRKVSFTAGHMYRGGGLSRQELEEIFGIAAEPSGHGHNYVLELSVQGEVNPVDGMVINIKDIDSLLRSILAQIDHKMINTAMPEFFDAVPTTERLAQVLWQHIPRQISAARPVSMRLEEHPGMYVEIFGENPEMIYLTRSIEFAASHRLHTTQLSDEENRQLYGKCNNCHGHGHNYVIEVTVAGTPDPRSGIVVDLGALERLLETEIEERFDHKHLNLDTGFFRDSVASAENIAIVIWKLLENKIPSCRKGGGVKLHRVRLIETARSWFDYYGA